MAELIKGTTWAIRGRTLTLPLRLPHAEAAGAVWSFRPAPDLLPAGSGLKPITVRGRALSALLLLKYGDWDLGRYDEVGVGVLVHGPRRRPGLYLLDLPVSGAFTCEAGRDLWALPKWLMRSELAFRPGGVDVTVHDGDRFVLRASLRAGRVPVPFRVPARMPTWAHLDRGAQAGVLLRGTVPMDVTGTRLGRGSAALQLGEHPMAARMRSLGMTGRPLLTVHSAHLQGSFGPSTRTAW